MVEFTVVHMPMGQRSTGLRGELGSTVRSRHQRDAWLWPQDLPVQMPSRSSPPGQFSKQPTRGKQLFILVCASFL